MDDLLRFSCPACGKRLKSPPAHAGKRARCSCGQSVIVPRGEPLSPGEQVAPPLETRRRVKPVPEPLLLPDPPTRPRSRKRTWLVAAGGIAALSLVVGVVFLVASPGKDRSTATHEVAAVTPTASTSAPPTDKKPEPKSDPEKQPGPTPDPKAAAKPKPKEGTQVAAPLLSNLAIESATTDPVVIKFSIELDVVRGTTPFEGKAGCWFCFGKPSTLPSLRSELQKVLKEADDRFFLNMRGPGFVAAQCSMKQDPDKPELWHGVINLGKANVQKEEIEIPSAFGSTFYKLTEMPISWVYYDNARRLSNELRAIVDLKAGKVVKVVEENRATPPKSESERLPPRHGG